MKDNKSSNNNKPADNARKPQGDDGKPADDKKRSALSFVLLALLLIVALLLLYLIRCHGKSSVGGLEPVPADTLEIEDTVEVIDTVPVAPAAVDTVLPIDEDSLARARAIADSLARLARARADSLARLRADSLARLKHIEDSLARLRAIEDSLARLRAIEDSLARLRDSLARLKALEDSLARARAIADSLARVVDPCARDTLQPWVYADPSGGLHRRAVSVKLVANKECRIEWRLNGAGEWKTYDGSPIDISAETTLHYRAQDSCGKTMAERGKRYLFDFTDRSVQCPGDMEYIKVGDREFCMDVYEWPNRAGVRPSAFVSMYQAMDSCFSMRKRLCTSDEWTTACAGPENWTYTYGNGYEGNTCVTRDTLPQRSGSRPECRGYFGVFDMSGNLAEWTSTPSPHDRSFNNVMGGFWLSGTQSRCADARYSYFPQNRHNPVGFRCCRDAGAEQRQRQRGGGRN